MCNSTTPALLLPRCPNPAQPHPTPHARRRSFGPCRARALARGRAIHAACRNRAIAPTAHAPIQLRRSPAPFTASQLLQRTAHASQPASAPAGHWRHVPVHPRQRAPAGFGVRYMHTHAMVNAISIDRHVMLPLAARNRPPSGSRPTPRSRPGPGPGGGCGRVGVGATSPCMPCCCTSRRVAPRGAATGAGPPCHPPQRHTPAVCHAPATHTHGTGKTQAARSLARSLPRPTQAPGSG